MKVFEPLFKFLHYLLAYHPEEFGLVPTYKDFFKIKEIFQVLIFTKNFKNVKIETLNQIFSYYYKDFFEITHDFKYVKAKEYYFSLPYPAPPSQIPQNILWSIIKPKIWYRVSLEEKWNPRNQKIILYSQKEIAENWAKVKGCLLLEVYPEKFPSNLPIFCFQETLFLADFLPFSAIKGPKIDEKFIKKYNLMPKTEVEKPEPIIPFHLDFPQEEIEEEIPFRKITRGKKRKKPWKKYQKEKQKEREIF